MLYGLILRQCHTATAISRHVGRYLGLVLFKPQFSPASVSKTGLRLLISDPVLVIIKLYEQSQENVGAREE